MQNSNNLQQKTHLRTTLPVWVLLWIMSAELDEKFLKQKGH